MRDPERIDIILKDIGDVWKRYPDMRLGQLILNVIQDPNLYYIEDRALINLLKDFY